MYRNFPVTNQPCPQGSFRCKEEGHKGEGFSFLFSFKKPWEQDCVNPGNEVVQTFPSENKFCNKLS